MYPHSKELRKGRFSSYGYTYLVTTTTYQRSLIFKDFYLSRLLINELKLSDEAGSTKTLGYVVMPDHIHWLFTLTCEEGLSTVIKTVKARSTLAINKLTSKSGPVWQQGFHDRCLRKEDNLAEVMRYIIANPLRAGLVDSVRRYSHWDCVFIKCDNDNI